MVGGGGGPVPNSTLCEKKNSKTNLRKYPLTIKTFLTNFLIAKHSNFNFFDYLLELNFEEMDILLLGKTLSVLK